MGSWPGNPAEGGAGRHIEKWQNLPLFLNTCWERDITVGNGLTITNSCFSSSILFSVARAGECFLRSFEDENSKICPVWPNKSEL